MLFGLGVLALLATSTWPWLNLFFVGGHGAIQYGKLISSTGSDALQGRFTPLGSGLLIATAFEAVCWVASLVYVGRWRGAAILFIFVIRGAVLAAVLSQLDLGPELRSVFGFFLLPAIPAITLGAVLVARNYKLGAEVG